MSIADKLTAIAENVPKVYDKGKADGIQSEYDRFWDIYQDNGNRTNYDFAFGGYGWTTENYKPKYPILPSRSAGMFRQTRMERIPDIDYSNSADMTQTFMYSQSKYIGVVDTTKANTIGQTFGHQTNLISIEKIILKNDGSQTFSAPINNCPKLQNLTIEGVIGNDGFNISQSPLLTHDSLMSIINALKDFSTTTTTKTLTFGTTNLAKLTDQEKAIATEKGWTLA